MDYIRGVLKDYIEDGHFVYAECGGLLYLTKNIIYEGLKNEMVGIFEADSKIIKKTCRPWLYYP